MSTKQPQASFGTALRHAHFAFSPSYLPLNHGSFGSHPKAVTEVNNAIRAQVEAAPDSFIVFDFARGAAKSRELTAKMLHCSPTDIVLVQNATVGMDTVFKNIEWEKGDVILCYEIIYGAVASELSWLKIERGVDVEMVECEWPIGDEEMVRRYVDAIRKINNEGEGKRRVRMAVCDTVVSMPGVRIPFEKLVPALKAEGVMVMLDAAHGVGHVNVDLGKLQPDFAVTNLHKWLFVPRPCAAFYVRKDQQEKIKTSLPTSVGYKPRPVAGEEPFPHSESSEFVELFDWAGTVDNTNFLCVEAALKFREEICGGEDTINSYCTTIAREAGDKVAAMFDTEIMDHPDSNMRDCYFSNVRLPLEIGNGEGQVKPENAGTVADWIKSASAKECNTYFQTMLYRGSWWWRISGQIYLELDDIVKGAEMLLGLCERIKKGEHVGAKLSPYHYRPEAGAE